MPQQPPVDDAQTSGQDALRQAQEALDAGNHALARQYLTHFLAHQQQEPDTRRVMAAYQMLLFACSKLPDSGILTNIVNDAFCEAERRGDRFFLGTCHSYKANLLIREGLCAEAIRELTEGLAMMEELDETMQCGRIHSTLAQCYLRAGDFAGAIREIEEALPLLEQVGDPGTLKRACNTATAIYLEACMFDRALASALKSLELEEHLPAHQGIRVTLLNIGLVYQQTGNAEKARQYYHHAIETNDPADNGATLAKIYNNFGNLESIEGNYLAAQEYYNRSLEIKEGLGDVSSIALACMNLGTFHLERMNNLPEAGNLLRRASGMFAAQKDHARCLEIDSKLALVAWKTGDAAQAATLLSSSMASVNKVHELRVRMDMYELAASLWSEMGEHEKAYACLREYLTLNHQFIDEEKYRALKEIEVRYETEKVEREKTIARQEAEIYRLENFDLTQRVEEEMKKRQRQQEIIIQKSKLESLGRMAASMAHEIGQPLSVIALGAEIIRQRITRSDFHDDAIDSVIDETQDCIRQLRSVIDNVRTFSREQKDSVFERIDINETLQRTLAMCRRQMEHHNIQLIEELDEPGYALGNPYKLQQVFFNLLANAMDAVDEMAEKANPLRYTKSIIVRTGVEGEMAFAEFEDNGVGMTEETQAGIFEPFFTTKSESRGTGLGLSICYGIIGEMQGTFKVRSAPGQGAVMRVFLPRA